MKKELEKTQTDFRLRPFNQAPMLEKLSITGSLTRVPDLLLVEYNLHGTLKSIKQPAPIHEPRRCHELWRHTCFELFFGMKGDPGYWEVNLCLSKRWNVYRFDGYRTGMREDKTIGQPVCMITVGSDCISLSCSLSLNGLIDKVSDLEVGVCSVIETNDGNIHCWAVKHQETKPDFHNRRNFLSTLPGLKG